MNRHEVRKLDHGLYRLYWKSGGDSIAAVGSLYDGTRWFAPTNWTSETEEGIAKCDWNKIEKVEAILT